MLYKLSVFVLLSIAGCVAAGAQQTPTAPTEKRVERVIMSAPFERSYLGVQAQEINKENFAKYGLASVRGVGVEKVVENSPAANAGLQNKDVIVRFEGEEVTSVAKLNRLISEVAPDHAAKIIVLRDGGEREINVTVGKREFSRLEGGNFRINGVPVFPATPEALENMQTVPLPPLAQIGGGGNENVFIWRGAANRQIGVGVVPLTKQLGDYFGVAEGKGLLINDVRENSPAAKAGLKAGDVIVEAEGKEVKGMMDLIRAVNEKKEGEVSLTIIRDRNRQTVRVTPENSKDGMMKMEQLNKLSVPGENEMNFQFQTPQPVQPPTAPIAPPAPVNQLYIAPGVL